MTSHWLQEMLVCSGVAAVVIGCSSGPPTVDKNDLASEISNQLEQEVGHAPDAVSCPEDLKGEVGAKQRCELKDGTDTYGVNVTVTSVDGTDVNFDLKVDETPQ